MKNPTVLAGILDPLGFIDILVSPPSSGLTSIANRSSFSFTKHNLGKNIFTFNGLCEDSKHSRWYAPFFIFVRQENQGSNAYTKCPFQKGSNPINSRKFDI